MALPRVLLIANRGEIVARIARTARSMGIRTVAVASDADRGALHTRVCDEVFHLGGVAASESYLRVDKLLLAAKHAGADAVHPGFGFLAEDAGFAQAVIDAGLTWVGPSPAVIASMGDKLAAKRLMASHGVPIIDGVELGAADGSGEWRAAAEQLGLPVLIKATAGGGGKGMRVVSRLDQLDDEVATARREAGAAFGDDRVFLERFIERSRHVEVQVLGDEHGNLVHLFERECSIQRRHQKIVEETPSPGIDEQVRTALTDAALTAARAIGYASAGTVEFIVDDVAMARRRAGEDVPPADVFAFLEVNTRLQVEHPVTEETVRRRDPATGSLQRIDLVREQLLVAAGERLAFEQAELVSTGHAIEVRLYAEDPAAGDLPGAGPVPVFAPVDGDGIRWEAGIVAGDVVPSAYDPMLAKVIAAAPTRLESAGRLAATLDATPLLGVPTNRDLLVQILRDEAFLAGETTTSLLEERRAAWLDGAAPTNHEVGLAASIAGLHATLWAQRDALVPGVPAGFSNTSAFPAQQVFTLVGPLRRTPVDPSVDAAGDADGPQGPGSAVPTGTVGAAEVGASEGPVGAAGAGVSEGPVGAAEAGAFEGPVGAAGAGVSEGPVGAEGVARDEPHLVVRVRPRRVGGHAVELLSGVEPGHLDEDIEVAHATTMTTVAIDAASITVVTDGRELRAAIHRAGAADGRVQVVIGSSRVTLRRLPRFPRALEQIATGASVSPMPGAVVAVPVAVGDVVQAGAVLATVEAMKTEHRVRATTPGTVSEIRVEPGQQVDADQVLVVVSAEGDGGDGGEGTDGTGADGTDGTGADGADASGSS